MYLVISVLIFIISVILILVVLIQNSKGGGLAANFSSSNQIMGVRKTTDFLEKTTWVLAGVMMFLSVVGSFAIPRGEVASQQSVIERQLNNSIDSSTLPLFPTTEQTPATETTEQAPTTEENN